MEYLVVAFLVASALVIRFAATVSITNKYEGAVSIVLAFFAANLTSGFAFPLAHEITASYPAWARPAIHAYQDFGTGVVSLPMAFSLTVALVTFVLVLWRRWMWWDNEEQPEPARFVLPAADAC